MLFSAALPARAERVTSAEAGEAAQGWVHLIERVKGHWGTTLRAQVGQVVALQVSNRGVGYYCPIVPEGYVVLKLYKELNPVLAYSVRGGLDPQESRGPSGALRGMLHADLQALEQRIGPLDAAGPDEFQAVIKQDYRPAWQKLKYSAPSPEAVNPKDATYQGGGGVLLSTQWGQDCPYNTHCPSDNCRRRLR
jgi:hypothetical protein